METNFDFSTADGATGANVYVFIGRATIEGTTDSLRGTLAEGRGRAGPRLHKFRNRGILTPGKRGGENPRVGLVASRGSPLARGSASEAVVMLANCSRERS